MSEEIWLVGASNTGKSSVVQLFTGSRNRNCVWHIDNKYYTADIPVKVCDFGTASSNLESKPEVFVFVFDCTSQASFETLKSWSEANPTDDAEIRIALANKADTLLKSTTSSAERPAWLDQAIDWCAENLIEYIEISCTSPELDAKLELDGDPMGFRRLSDALQAHAWPSLVRKERHAQKPSHAEPLAIGSGHADSHEATQGHATQPEAHSKGHQKQCTSQPEDTAPACQASTGPDAANETSALSTCNGHDASPAPCRPAPGAGGAGGCSMFAEFLSLMDKDGGLGGLGDGDGDDEDELDMKLEEFDKLMMEIQGMGS